MTDVPPEKLVTAYQRGAITDSDLIRRLIKAAVHYSPEDILPFVPEELLTELRQQGMNPPKTLEAVLRTFSIVSVCNSGPHDPVAEEREERTTYYEGAWRWHRFLTNQ